MNRGNFAGSGGFRDTTGISTAAGITVSCNFFFFHVFFHSNPTSILELDPGFPGSIGQSLNYAVIQVSVAVKDHGFNILFQKPFAHQLAKLGGTGNRILYIPQFFFQSGSGSQGMALSIINDLNRNSAVAFSNGHPGPLGRTGYRFTDMYFSFEPFPVFFQQLSQHTSTLTNSLYPYPGEITK
jgi:hypothetical protein